MSNTESDFFKVKKQQEQQHLYINYLHSDQLQS